MCPRIKIEEKHTYNSVDDFITGNQRLTQVASPATNYVWFEPTYPVAGTDENNRIGRKIQSQSIGFEAYLTLNTLPQTEDTYPNLLDYFNGFMQEFVAATQPDMYEFNMDWQKLLIPIRHMVVEFDDEAFYDGTNGEKGVYLNNWFKNLVTQSMATPENLPSIQQATLRESTPYTGRFRILKDTMYWLDYKDKHSIHINYQLPYKRTINFEAQGSDPTNCHLYFLFIGPLNPLLDYGNLAFGEFLNGSGADTNIPPNVARIYSTIKLKYIDV